MAGVTAFPWVSNRAWTPGDESKRIPSKILMKCKCGSRYYSQKNIGGIGMRSIFHFAGGCAWMQAQFQEPECSCPGSDLEIDEQLMAHIIDCDECKEYGY